jgi:hypothetical protein
MLAHYESCYDVSLLGKVRCLMYLRFNNEHSAFSLWSDEMRDLSRAPCESK